MHCLLGASGLILGLLSVRVTWTWETEASSLYSALPADDSFFLLQVSGTKRVAGQGNASKSGARKGSTSPDSSSAVPQALAETNHTVVMPAGGDRRDAGQPWPLSLLSISLCRVVEEVTGHQVPTKEGMMFTACMIAAIIVLSVCIALLHQSSARDARGSRIPAGGIPGAVEETVRDLQDQMEETFTPGLKKPRPAWVLRPVSPSSPYRWELKTRKSDGRMERCMFLAAVFFSFIAQAERQVARDSVDGLDEECDILLLQTVFAVGNASKPTLSSELGPDALPKERDSRSFSLLSVLSLEVARNASSSSNLTVMLLVALAMVFIIPLIVYLLSEPCSYLEGPGGKLLERGSLGPRREAPRTSSVRGSEPRLSIQASQALAMPPTALARPRPDEDPPKLCENLILPKHLAIFLVDAERACRVARVMSGDVCQKGFNFRSLCPIEWEKLQDDAEITRATLLHNLRAHEDEEDMAAELTEMPKHIEMQEGDSGAMARISLLREDVHNQEMFLPGHLITKNFGGQSQIQETPLLLTVRIRPRLAPPFGPSKIEHGDCQIHRYRQAIRSLPEISFREEGFRWIPIFTGEL
ncbi:unnamed protein product [Symbiodinium sp. KB8]|nr:unnamed protein product [Symbiodinium sp. KB8]